MNDARTEVRKDPDVGEGKGSAEEDRDADGREAVGRRHQKGHQITRGHAQDPGRDRIGHGFSALPKINADVHSWGGGRVAE